MTTNEKYYLVSALEQKFGFAKDSIFDVMLFETSGTLNPAIKAGNSSATGLIQFLESTALRLGTTTALLRLMTFENQLFYVEKYFSWYKASIKASGDPFDVYCAVLYPVLIGKPDSAIMNRLGTLDYNMNKSFDFNKDGLITKGEIRKIFNDRVSKFRGKLNLIESQVNSSGAGKGLLIGALLIVGFVIFK